MSARCNARTGRPGGTKGTGRTHWPLADPNPNCCLGGGYLDRFKSAFAIRGRGAGHERRHELHVQKEIAVPPVSTCSCLTKAESWHAGQTGTFGCESFGAEGFRIEGMRCLMCGAYHFADMSAAKNQFAGTRAAGADADTLHRVFGFVGPDVIRGSEPPVRPQAWRLHQRKVWSCDRSPQAPPGTM